MQILTINEIKTQYPDEWVLVANPNLGGNETFGTIIKKIIGGIVLLHSKDKHEVAYKGREARQGYDSVTLIFTGEIPKKRKFWL
jgi:hypothetical protein